VTTTAQTFAGLKTFSGGIACGSFFAIGSDGAISGAITINLNGWFGLGDGANGGLQLASGNAIGWSASSSINPSRNSISGDIQLRRRVAGVLSQRSATQAQVLEVYNTYTSDTSLERVSLGWSSNVCTLTTEKGSAGGTLRGLKIGDAATALLGFYGVTPVDQPATVTDPTGGGTIDAEARTAINAIIDRLQELGLIA
jgi:hypothetical protein